jgi:hypothetical protein
MLFPRSRLRQTITKTEFHKGEKMKKTMTLLLIVSAAFQLTGCTVVAMHAASTRMEEARSANAGKQLVPKDGQTRLIVVGQETLSYLGTGDTDWKINDTSFTQPRGTYSLIEVRPGIYHVYGNKRVLGGGEARSTIEVKEGESVCIYPVNPMSGPARMESYKGDACEPALRQLKNKDVIKELNKAGSIQTAARPSSAFADINDSEKLAQFGPKVKEGYDRFLARPLPRAFAFSEKGGAWSSWGTTPKNPDSAKEPSLRAVPDCEAYHHATCFLYAVDNDVVYQPRIKK